MAAEIIDLDERRNDLHLSEWCWFLRSEAIDLEAIALAFERNPSVALKTATMESLDRLESLLGAVRRVARRA
jgi:hypothetical protein